MKRHYERELEEMALSRLMCMIQRHCMIIQCLWYDRGKAVEATR